MMTPSHLGATLLLGLLASRAFRAWDRREWALALGFGVLIDLDHALALPAYLANAGAAGLAPAAMAAHGAAWQGVMHTPWGLLVAIAAGAATRSPRRAWVPLAFWGLHMFQDFVVAIRWVRFGSPLEFGVALALLASAAVLAPRDWRARLLRRRDVTAD